MFSLSCKFNSLLLNVMLVITPFRSSVFSQRLGGSIGDTKQPVHSLERNALCFRHEEPNEEKHAEAEAAKDKICPALRL
jgi:hypothetical protein